MFRIKSISKRALAMILSMLMLLSSGIVGTLAANVDFAETGAYTELAETGATITYTSDDVLFFNRSAVSWWPATGNFAYFFNNSTNANGWSSVAKQYSGDTYYVTIPAGTWTHVILTRNSVTSNPSWDNKYNQTGDIVLQSGKNYISSFSENSTTATWSTQQPTSAASLTASSSSVNTGTAVTLTPKLTNYTTYNEIKSTSYSSNKGGTFSGNTFTPSEAGTHTITATITYNPRGYNTLTKTVTATTTITVTQPGFSYTVTAGEGGTVSPTSGTATSAQITATPNEGYKFAGWNVTGSGSVADASSATTTLTINANGVVATASFEKEKYTITFVNGDGTTTTLENVEYGSDITSQAPTPSEVAGKTFSSWNSNLSGSTLAKVTGVTTFTATYTDDLYSVTVNSAAGGTATAEPDTDVKYGDTVTLTATVTDDAYVFSSWTIEGDYSFVDGYDADDATTKVTVNGPITVTPVFVAKDPYTLTVNQTGGTGVKVDNISYTDATSVINSYNGKTHSVTVGAPLNHYIKSLKLDGVDVDSSKYTTVCSAVFTVTITANTVIDVEFAYNPEVGADLDVTGGKVTVETGKRDVTNEALPVTYKANVPYEITAPTGYYINQVKVDDSVVFTASANEFKLTYSGTIPTITTNTTITVDFEKIPTLTITVVADTTNGSVSPAVGSYEHQANDVINFTATPNSGYFVEWHVDGKKVATGTSYSHTVTKSSTVEAKFIEVPWTGEVYLEIASGLCSGDWKNGAFAYATDNSLGGWPGTEMTYVETLSSGNKVYVVNGVAPLSTLVFKAKDVEMQTKDIVMEANKNYYILTNCYNSNGWQSTGSWSSEYKYDPDVVMSYVLYGINGSVISAVEKSTGGYSATYRGTTTFPEQDSVTSAVDTSNAYYAKVSIAEEQSVDIITTVISDDFVVDGWVVNGTKFVKATPTGTAKEFRGTIPADYLDEYANDAVAVYSHSTSWFAAHPDVETVQVFADISKIADSSIYNWGEYITAYTWTRDYADGSGYQQFGEWIGQLMIPVGDDQPGVYYTNVEKTGIDGYPIKGITFTNFGGNAPANSGVGFIQTYDYYEFITLQEKDNIIFALQPTDTSVNLTDIGNYTSTSSANSITDKGLNAPLVDYGNEIIDIYRDVLTEEEIAANEIGLYVVRTGPNDASTTTNSEAIDGEFFIDCYVYDADKKYIGKCKSFELLDLDTLVKTNTAFAKLVNNKSDYEGKLVQVFYEAPNTTNNTRVDGEWYGTDGTETVTFTTRVALKTDSGYQVADSNTATYGTATIGGLAVWSGPQGTQNLQSAVTTDSDHKFVGWYHGTLDANGNVVVDTTKDAITIYTDYSFTAYSNSYYVAVFEELASGTFTVNNFSYEGNANNASAPPVYNKIGRDASFRYVQIDKVDSNYNVIEAGTKSDTYFATTNVQEGEILKITIYTTPKYTTDYVYAWYMEALEDDGTLNFEEVGTEELAKFGNGEEASFSFYYEITADYQKNMIIYSDIVTKTADITLDYRYLNRYGKEVSYTKVYTLLGEELANNAPSEDTIAAYAPYVNDLYKDITWKIKNCVADSTGTRFVLEAVYNEDVTVNISVNGDSYGSLTGKFNEPCSVYATTYAPEVTNKGFWYVENGEDGEFTEGVDTILSYGTYYGLVFTKDMSINYVEQDKLDFKVVLNSPIYGREQSVGGIDKVYTDFIINYLVPYFSGDKINDKEVLDLENRNAPIQLDIYAEAAGKTIEYGMVHQLVNTLSSDSTLNETNKDTYYNTDPLTAEEIAALEAFLNSGKTKGMNAYGNGQLYNYKYTGSNEDLTNKNRALMTFITENTANSRKMHYTVVAYLAIKDNVTNETVYYFSNVELFNINDFVNQNTDDLIDRN